jgi:RNA polymerase sigma-70 factor, ECF subfamily
MENAELKIIEKCQKGELEQFGQLYESYVDKIYHFLYYRTAHKETAEDLTSTTFIKALDNIKKFNPSKGVFLAWLFRIARNSLYDFYRAKKDIVDIDEVIFFLSSPENLPADLDAKNKLKEVEVYLKELPAREREIIVLRVWDELSYREISELLGKSEAACKMAFSRAIGKLREQMPLSVFIAFLLKMIN